MITTSTISADFTVQASKSNYTKLTPGSHHLRILGPAISGYEVWEDTAEGGRKPLRFGMGESVPVEYGDIYKKFLAWAVWNYDEKRIQILEITQMSIQKELIALERNKKWGDLKTFDIEIERTGIDKNTTKYAVRPEPKTEFEEEVLKAVKEKGLPALEALFSGADPFNYNPDATVSLEEEEIINKDLPF